jgi:pantoate--beta-alanine ligase
MEVVRDRASLAAARTRLAGPVAMVPTMGALHAGHEALIARAAATAASVVVSIFVNPRQFAPHEDLSRYPRDEPADLDRCERAGVHLVFAPPVEEIYPEGATTVVDVGPLGERLEGAARPGHFRGVATVVTVLLSLVRPDIALFGQKDGQQTLVIKRLVRDLGLGVDVRVVPTVREPDGLAMSSRNRYLGPDERAAAPVLSRALQAAADAHRMGERDAGALRRLMREVLAAEPLATPDYVSVADEATLDELDTIDRPALLSLAVRFPSARLIDCIPVG